MDDPGGVFKSNTHRKVLAHLSTHTDEHRWHPVQLVARMVPDPDTWFSRPEDIEVYLRDLEADGLADHDREGWRMTEQGFQRLTGPIANEPPPTAAPEPEKRKRFRRR